MDSHMDLFVVEHLHIQDSGDEDVKLIGIYSTKEAARQAVERLKLKPGFCDTPDGFSINLHILDEDNWTEGYATLHYSDDSEKGGMSPGDDIPDDRKL